MVTAANPEIYGKNITETSLPKISETVKEKTKELKNYQAILEDLEKNVILKQVELEKQKLRNIAYATNINRGARKEYLALADSLKNKSGYLAPKNAEDKVFYDITFRLKELGFAKNIDLSQKVDYNDKLAREIIAFQKLAQLRGQEGVVGPETLKALLKNEVTASTVLGAATNSGELQNAYDYADQSGVTTNPVVENMEENKTEKTETETSDAGVDKESQAIKIHYNYDHLTPEQDKRFRYLEDEVNDGDSALLLLLEKFLEKFTENQTTADNKKIHLFEGNAEDLFYEFVEGGQKLTKEEKKKMKELIAEGKRQKGDIEVTRKFNDAFEYAITAFLTDPTKSTEQKDRLVLFIKSFTDSYDKILPEVTAYKIKKTSKNIDSPLTLK